MKIALPLTGEQLSLHFGHCESFAIIDVDLAEKKILNTEQLTPPPHEPGVLPAWLKEQEVDLVITAGMGFRAQSLFESKGIKVITGAPSAKITDLVQDYLEGTLTLGQNFCDH